MAIFSSIFSNKSKSSASSTSSSNNKKPSPSTKVKNSADKTKPSSAATINLKPSTNKPITSSAATTNLKPSTKITTSNTKSLTNKISSSSVKASSLKPAISTPKVSTKTSNSKLKPKSPIPFGTPNLKITKATSNQSLKSDASTVSKSKSNSSLNKTKKSIVIDTKNPESVKDAFNRFDQNGNGILSLAEIDDAVINLLPQFADDKPAIMRAYRAADVSNDGFIDIDEFARLIDLLYYYDKLYKIFLKLDKNNDRRISFEEFKAGHELVGIKNTNLKDLRKKFNEIDKIGQGYIRFEEFTLFMAKQDEKKKFFQFSKRK
ncbi:hypothetical protein HK099_005030 [Clydaea vesicula]|uniref:EF-hand domain-containing protein n=1 Tax=Clydaea vesicula TaxID=447962 RepID=A0AAD5XV77_9FUNG|nr:hypothetical protein HK099_005030 [Clydaea vesicula]